MKKILTFLLISALVVGSGYAAERVKVRKFKGLNTRVNPYEIDDAESPDMSNFVLDTAGSLDERALFKHYNTASIGSLPVTNVYKFYKSSDAGFMIVSAGTELYEATGGTLSSLGLTTNTVTSGSDWGFETFQDTYGREVAFAANNDAILSVWDGTGGFNELEETQAPAENCNILQKHRSRLFASGSSEYPYRLYYSSLTDGGDWNNTGGTIDLPSYEKIMGLEILSDILYIFTRTTVYGLYGATPNEFSIVPTRSTVGTHATKSITVGNKVIFFLNKGGVFAFDGDQSVNISETIEPNISDISDTYLSKAAGVYDTKGKLFLAVASTNATYNDKIYVYDTVVKQWYPLDGGSFTSFFKADGGTDKGELFAGGATGGWLWQLQSSASIESVIHYTKSQLQSGVTRNAVFQSVELDPIMMPILSGYNYVDKLRMYFEDANNSTNIIDDSNYAKTVTVKNDAVITTDQYKMGVSCLDVTQAGGDDYIEVGDSIDFAFGTGDLSISFWLRLGTISADQDIMGQYAAANDRWDIRYNRDTPNTRFLSIDGGVVDIEVIATCSTLNIDQWYHFEYTRLDGEWYIFEDGVSLTLTTETDGSHDNYADNLNIGLSDPAQPLNGWLDNIRIVKGEAGHITNFDPEASVTSCELNSINLLINAAGQSTLGAVQFNSTKPASADVQITCRTGVTDDTTYDTWTGPWVSTSTILAETNDDTAWASNALITVAAGADQLRDIKYYEWDDEDDPDCVKFTTTGIVAKTELADHEFAAKDISSYKWLGFWLKSPVTGDSVKISIGETSPTVVAYVTANTVDADTWEYHYWPLKEYSSSDLNAVTYLSLTYLGDAAGDIYLGKVAAYDFLDSGETITADPDNYIEYKAVLGTTFDGNYPELNQANAVVVSLSYYTGTGTEETSLSSYYQTKVFDNGNEYNKFYQWVELTAECTTGNSSTLYVDYDCEDGDRTGTLSKVFPTTANRVKMRFYFPSGTYGKDIQLKIRDTDLDNDLKIHNMTMSYVQES